jgi:hypothetical protein
MDFSTGTALNFESVPEVVLRSVIGPEISYPSSVSLVLIASHTSPTRSNQQ